MALSDDRQYAPATLRDRDFILDVRRDDLPMTGVILEIASGSGEHIVHFAKNFAALVFLPSDPEPDPIASANGYNRSDTEQLRIRPEPAGARTRDELCVPGAGAGTFAPCSAVQIEPHNGRVRRSQALSSALPDPDTIPWGIRVRTN